MSTRDSRADRSEKLEALFESEIVRIRIFPNLSALNILHNEIWQAVLGRSAIEHTGDVGMIELSENPPLHQEPLEDGRRVHSAFYELERHQLLKAIAGVFRKVHRTHATRNNRMQ